MTNSPSISGLTAEQAALLDTACEAWNLQNDAKQWKSPLGEETVTELTLLLLKRAYPSHQLSIVPFTKNQEGKLGADWAWAFCDKEYMQVMPMLVQAKILNRSEKGYDEIKRKIGRANIRQIDRLLRSARFYGWPAIYLFYNHLINTSLIPHACKTLSNQGISLPESWGISFADAYSVKSKLDSVKPEDQSFKTHSRHSMPLHCLLCSEASGVRPAGGTGWAAFLALQKMSTQSPRDNMLFDVAEDAAVLPGTPISKLPDMFVKALQIHDLQPSRERDEAAAKLSDAHPHIAGVVVLRDMD